MHYIVSVPPHPLRKDDVFVFSGHTCGPFPCFFIQTVFFSCAALLQQFPDLKRPRKREFTLLYNTDPISEYETMIASQCPCVHESPSITWNNINLPN